MNLAGLLPSVSSERPASAHWGVWMSSCPLPCLWILRQGFSRAQGNMGASRFVPQLGTWRLRVHPRLVSERGVHICIHVYMLRRFLYVYIYICVCVYTCMYTIYLHAYPYVYLFIQMYMYLYMCVPRHACIFICYICMHIHRCSLYLFTYPLLFLSISTNPSLHTTPSACPHPPQTRSKQPSI